MAFSSGLFFKVAHLNSASVNVRERKSGLFLLVLRILLGAMKDSPAHSKHQQREPSQSEPMRVQARRVLVAEDAQHDLRKVIRRQRRRNRLQPLGQHVQRHP